jgi:hypothetical protein
VIPCETIHDRLQRAFLPTQGGVVGLTEQLLGACAGTDVEFERVGDRCVYRWTKDGKTQEAPAPLSPAAFRTVLARIATRCNEQSPGSVSPYGGEGDLVVGGTGVFVRFINTTDSQKLEVKSVPGGDTVPRPLPAVEDGSISCAPEPPQQGEHRNGDSAGLLRPREGAAVEEHASPDGLLRFLVVTGDDGDVELGFDGFPCHTHADILADLTGLPEAEAVRQYVDDLVGGKSVIVLWSVDGELRDVWVSDDPVQDAGYAHSAHAAPGESVVLRYWDGRSWRNAPGAADHAENGTA